MPHRAEQDLCCTFCVYPLFLRDRDSRLLLHRGVLRILGPPTSHWSFLPLCRHFRGIVQHQGRPTAME
eukprot:928809-Pyramimonas_sp.AAC.1